MTSSGDNVQYPSFEGYRQETGGMVPQRTHDFLRLRWFIREGPPEDCLKVLTNVYDKNSAQEPYLTRTSAGSDGPGAGGADATSLPAASTPSVQLHPVTAGSITNPPISSVSVKINVLDARPSGWDENHSHHRDDVDEDDDDEGDGDGDDADRWPNKCPCGSVRPGPGPEVLLKPADGRPFVTVGDYVATMHPWLVEHEDLLREAAMFEGPPLDRQKELFVLTTGLERLLVKWSSYDLEWVKVNLMARVRMVPVGGVHPDELPSTQPLSMASL